MVREIPRENESIIVLTLLAEVYFGLGKRIEAANPAYITPYFKVRSILLLYDQCLIFLVTFR